jgi:hypothetical protein
MAVKPGSDVVSGVEFPADNDSYLRWTAAHPAGYVINIQRSLNASDARLHRAGCHWINGVPPRGHPATPGAARPCDGGPQRGTNATRQVPAAAAGHRGARRQRGRAPGEGAVTDAEAGRLAEACRPLPVRPWEYEEHDYTTT